MLSRRHFDMLTIRSVYSNDFFQKVAHLFIVFQSIALFVAIRSPVCRMRSHAIAFFVACDRFFVACDRMRSPFLSHAIACDRFFVASDRMRSPFLSRCDRMRSLFRRDAIACDRRFCRMRSISFFF